jgi:hypothetical protein
MRQKTIVVARRRPTVHNVHDAAGLMAGIINEAREIETMAEAVGSGLYRLVPVDMEIERRLDDMQEEI